MFDYFKNIANKNACNSGGICSIHPSVNSLYENILYLVSEISFYVVKMKEFGFENKTITAFLVEVLSIFLINTSFNRKKYLDLILKLDTLKSEIKEKYVKYCSINNLTCEVINNNLKIDEKTTISKLIEYIETASTGRKKNFDKEKLNLFELIVLMAKISAINVIKIKKLEKDFDKFDYEIVRFFALVNGYSIRNSKIVRRILEFSNIALEIRKKLFFLYTKCYGKKESAKVNISLLNGSNILVSGDDLDELDNVLKTIEKYNFKEKINVYTNGSLILAHFYPYFKNNKFLKGHYGTDSAEYDFSNFIGSILITQNFVQKIDSLYRGEIFSKKLISFTKVNDIKDDDYLPLIEASLKLSNNAKNSETIKIKEIEFDKDKFDKVDKNKKELVIIAGRNNLKDCKIECKKETIFINSSLEGDLLIEKLPYFQENNIKLSIFFAECNLINLDLLFVLLNYDFEIYLASCSNALINPHIIEALGMNFNLKIV